MGRTREMYQHDMFAVVLLCSLQLGRPLSLHLSTGGDPAGGANPSLALYQAPPTYKEPGKPRLNSIIIKSKPYMVNDSTIGIHQAKLNNWYLFLKPTPQECLHFIQTEDGKTWRREALISPTPVPNIITQDEGLPDVATTEVTTVSEDIVTLIPQYTIECTGEKQTCSETISISESATTAPTFKPYSQEELDKYLFQATMSTAPKIIPKTDEPEKPTNKLGSIYIEDETVNILETTPNPTNTNTETQDKSKSWNLINSQVHKHPYDDRNGWVSLEPIPWSSSQIQKWEPNPHTRPQLPSWPEQHHQPWSKPSQQPPRPSQEYNRPSWHKPVYDYSRPIQEHYQKPSSSVWNNNYNPPSPPYGPPGGGNHWGSSSSDIVTDGRPGQFPSDKPPWEEQPSPSYQGAASYHRPTQVIYHKPVNNHQTSHHHSQADTDGQWVLLSSTKGYSIPQPSRHRSFQRSLKTEDVANFGTVVKTAKPQIQPMRQQDENIEPPKQQPSMKSHRTVRLTVLPPLNGTTNTTVSHGGLIEVEQTHQTVDEAHREHMAKMMKLWNHEDKTGRDLNINNSYINTNENVNDSMMEPKAERRVGTFKVITGSPMTQKSKSRNSAVLAAVGAGMIPATMAMLLPMVLGKKRRKRDTMTKELFVPAESFIEQYPRVAVHNVDDANSTQRTRRKPNKKLNIRKKTQVVYY